MQDSKLRLFGNEELTQHLNNYLLAQVSILKAVSKSSRLKDRANDLRVVLMSSVGIAVAISRLGKESMLNECVMLVRAFLERIINYCYLLVASEEEYKKYKNYSLQKSYRKLHREISVNDHKLSIGYTGTINPEKIPNLREALDEFTGPSGGEKTRWTNVDLAERVQLIGNSSKIDERKWLLSVLSFYEDASEALHGTFYGSTFHLGIHEPGFDKNNLQEIKAGEQKKLSLLLWQIGDLISDVISFLDERYSLEDFVNKSNENSKHTHDIMKTVLSQS